MKGLTTSNPLHIPTKGNGGSKETTCPALPSRSDVSPSLVEQLRTGPLEQDPNSAPFMSMCPQAHVLNYDTLPVFCGIRVSLTLNPLSRQLRSPLARPISTLIVLVSRRCQLRKPVRFPPIQPQVRLKLEALLCISPWQTVETQW